MNNSSVFLFIHLDILRDKMLSLPSKNRSIEAISEFIRNSLLNWPLASSKTLNSEVIDKSFQIIDILSDWIILNFQTVKRNVPTKTSFEKEVDLMCDAWYNLFENWKLLIEQQEGHGSELDRKYVETKMKEWDGFLEGQSLYDGLQFKEALEKLDIPWLFAKRTEESDDSGEDH